MILRADLFYYFQLLNIPLWNRYLSTKKFSYNANEVNPSKAFDIIHIQIAINDLHS